jgi:hypothetical protein
MFQNVAIDKGTQITAVFVSFLANVLYNNLYRFNRSKLSYKNIWIIVSKSSAATHPNSNITNIFEWRNIINVITIDILTASKVYQFVTLTGFIKGINFVNVLIKENASLTTPFLLQNILTFTGFVKVISFGIALIK